MAEYTLKSCSPLGKRDDKYGQAYWAEANESSVPVMFNSMGEVGPGQKISFESMAPMVSKKGTDYMRLKKVRVVGGDVVTSAPQKVGDMAYVIEMLEELTGRKKVEEKPEVKEEDTVIEDMDDDEEVDLNDIPF